MTYLNLPFQIDIIHPKSWVENVSNEDHIKFVDKFVNKLIKKGFEAQVETYDGPGGGAAVVNLGPGKKSFDEFDRYMLRVYGPWDPEA